jgi:hypothetical protein
MDNHNEFLVIFEYEGTTANKRQLFGVRGFGSEYRLFWRDINSNFLPTYDNDDFPWSYLAFSEKEEPLFRNKYKKYISFQPRDDDDPPYDCVLDKEVIHLSDLDREFNKILIEEIQKEINAEVIRKIGENSKA